MFIFTKVSHTFTYAFLSTCCEYSCHLCTPWPLKLAKLRYICLIFKSTGRRLTCCHIDPTVVCLVRVRTLRETQPWTSPQVSDRYLSAHPYPTVGQISPRTRKSMSLDMGQPSQANTKKLLGVYHLKTSSIQDVLLCCWSFTANCKKVQRFVLCHIDSWWFCLSFRYQEELWSSHIRFQSIKKTRDGVGYDDPSQDEACSRKWLWFRWDFTPDDLSWKIQRWAVLTHHWRHSMSSI